MTAASAEPAPDGPRTRRPSRLRRALVQLGGTIVVLAGVELVLRVAGVDPAPVDPDPFVGFTSSRPLFVPSDDGEWLVTAPYKRNHFNEQRFPAEKAEGTTRIFCLGGSTTYGRPYTDPTSFAGWLRVFLPVADPSRRWEVVNAGGISYASYRVARVMEELLAYEPDVFIVYTGHNEFLEERTYGELRETPELLLDARQGIGATLGRTALFSLVRRWTRGAPASAAQLPEEVSTILDRSVGPDAYTRDDALRTDVLTHFRVNLVRMARMARGVDAKLLFVSPASQLAGCAPFKSEHGVDVPAEDRARIAALLALAAPADGGPPPDAKILAPLQEATDLDPRYALSWYRLGEARLALGDVDGARAALSRARDEDVVPLRAPTEVNDIVGEIAEQEDVSWIDGTALVAGVGAVDYGAPVAGPELFLDHVHMTPDGYRHLALALLELLRIRGVVDVLSTWTEAEVARVTAQVEATLDTEAHVRALGRLAAVLDWAGKRAEAEALTARALAMSGGGDAMSHWQQGNYLRDRGDLAGAVESYGQAIAIDSEYLEARFNLARVLQQLGRHAEAVPQLARALELSPEDARVHFALGVSLEELGQVREARESYRAAAALDETLADAHNRLGITYLRVGKETEAEHAFRAAIAADPTSARPRYNLGLVLAAAERPAQALVAFRGAVEADPDHVGARRRLGEMLAQQGRWEEACEHLAHAAQLAPDDPRVTELLREVRDRLPFQDRR